jgi:hypothetical protein
MKKKAEVVSSPQHHINVSSLLRFFEYKHLPENLQEVSRPLCELAHQMADIPNSPEVTAGLRKLLEAKDCFVRAKLMVSK